LIEGGFFSSSVSMIWGAEEEAVEGVAFVPFLFLRCSLLQILQLFLRHSLLLPLYDSFLTGGRLGGGGGDGGGVRTGAFAGHVAGFPASEAGSFLPQLVTDLRSEFREVLVRTAVDFFLSTSMGRLCDRDVSHWS